MGFYAVYEMQGEQVSKFVEDTNNFMGGKFRKYTHVEEGIHHLFLYEK